MKINWSKLFSLSVSDSEYFNDTSDKIEYTGCKKTKKSCLAYLPVINDSFRESDQYYRDRDFNRAIDALESAYYKAGELQETECLQCALFFQATVMQSLESIHNELARMSKGLFATRRYQPSYLKADRLLKKMKPVRETSPSIPLANSGSSLQPALL